MKGKILSLILGGVIALGSTAACDEVTEPIHEKARNAKFVALVHEAGVTTTLSDKQLVEVGHRVYTLRDYGGHDIFQVSGYIYDPKVGMDRDEAYAIVDAATNAYLDYDLTGGEYVDEDEEE